LTIGITIWLLQKPKIAPKAVNRGKITLDLTRIQTTPPKPPAHIRPPLPQKKRIVAPTPRKQKPVATKPTVKPEPAVSAAAKRKPQKSDIPEIGKSENNLSKTDNTIKKTVTGKTGKSVKKITKTEHIRNKKTFPAKQALFKQRPVQKPRKRRKHIRPTPQGPDRRLISSLYGNSYSRLSSAQRRFIDENLRKILEISQRTLNYLGYPTEAVHFREQGTNLVEFWLHPNGDISGLRLRRRIGSPSLDRQTIEVIKTAYMHYPRPKVRTKIIIYVRYRLY
jgi:TonB family protein